MEKEVFLACITGIFSTLLIAICFLLRQLRSIRENKLLAWLIVIFTALTAIQFSYIIIIAEVNTSNPIFAKVAIIVTILCFLILLSRSSIKTIRKKRLFYYDGMGNRDLISEAKNFTAVVSEVKFPRREKGDCVETPLRKISISEGQMVDLLFGDPRKLKKCGLVSKDAQDAPELMQKKEKERGHKIWKFEYKRRSWQKEKYFWACEFSFMKIA